MSRKSWRISFESSDSLRDRERRDGGEGGEPCALANRCAERDYQGNAKCGPRAFCGTDREWILRAVESLPEDYARLWSLLPRSGQQEERVSGSKEPPVPLHLDIQAQMRELVHVALSWEEHVRETARLADLPAERRRDIYALAQASRTLSAHLDTLLALQDREVSRYLSPSRLKDLGDEEDANAHWVRWDASGDAWEYVTMDGTAAALELLALHGRARGVAGLNRQRRRITEVECDDCGTKTLIQREAAAGGWEPVVRCTNCPGTYYGPRLELLMARVYQVQMRALRHAA